MGAHNRSEMAADLCMFFVAYHPVTVTSMYTTHNEMLEYKDMAAGIFQNMMFSAREER
jgi:hypothetical protein